MDEFEDKEILVKMTIDIFDSMIRSRKPLPFWKSHRSKYALILFSCSKISFTIVSFLQLYFLDRFIGNGSQLFGVEVLSKMWHGESLSQWTIFPRDTICYLKYPDDEIDHQYSVCWITLVFIICYCCYCLFLFSNKSFLLLYYYHIVYP